MTDGQENLAAATPDLQTFEPQTIPGPIDEIREEVEHALPEGYEEQPQEDPAAAIHEAVDATVQEADLNPEELSPDIRETLASALRDLDRGAQDVQAGMDLISNGRATQEAARERMEQALELAATEEAISPEPEVTPVDDDELPSNVVPIVKRGQSGEQDVISVPDHLKATTAPDLQVVPDLITSDQVPGPAPEPAPAPIAPQQIDPMPGTLDNEDPGIRVTATPEQANSSVAEA